MEQDQNDTEEDSNIPNSPKPKSGLEQDKSVSKLVRGSAILFVGRLIAVFMKFVIQVIIVNYLPKESYGAFAYAMTMVDMAVILSLVALDKSASRFVPIFDEQKDYDALFGFIIISLMTILGAGTAIVLFFIGGQGFLTGTLISDPLAASLLVILIMLAPLQALDNWFQSIFAAFSNVRVIFFRRYILLPLLQLLAVLFVVVTQSNVFWLAGGYLLGGAIGTVMYISLMMNMLRKRAIIEHFDFKKAKLQPGVIFGFSLPMFFTGFVIIIRSQLAVIILESIHGTVAVAEYRAVEPIVRLNELVYSSFVFLYLPLASRLFAKNDHEGINDIFWRTAAWIAIVNLPVFFATFSLSAPVVGLLFPDSYASSAIIMSIMSVGVYFNSVMGFNKDTLRAYNKVRFLFTVDIIVMFVALGSYFLFIPQYGALGAAISFTLANIVNNLLYHVGLVRFVGMKIFEAKYALIYGLIAVSTVGLGVLQVVLGLSLWIGLFIAAVISIALVRLSANQLQVKEMFPELMRVPILKQLIR